MNALQEKPSRWWFMADKVGATASFLCAIHCAVLPFVLVLLPTLLPMLGLGFLANHWFDIGFVVFACMLALTSLISGFRHHGHALPLWLALPGLALLLVGVSIEDYSTVLHGVLMTCGGLLVATAHFINLRTHRAQCAHC